MGGGVEWDQSLKHNVQNLPTQKILWTDYLYKLLDIKKGEGEMGI